MLTHDLLSVGVDYAGRRVGLDHPTMLGSSSTRTCPTFPEGS